jgi:hypothetical protein
MGYPVRGATPQDGSAVQRLDLRDGGFTGSSIAVNPNLVDEALEGLSPAPEKLYAKLGRPSIASEQLLRPAVPGVLFGTAKLAGAVA